MEITYTIFCLKLSSKLCFLTLNLYLLLFRSFCMSEFEGDGLSNQDFEKSLKRFEDMISSGTQQFFDADELEEIIDYYMQWFNLELAKKALDFALDHYPYSSSLKIKLAQFFA